MDFPITSILIAGAMPWICTGIAKAGQKNYDNHNPREWLAKQTGYRARAKAGQANGFEPFQLNSEQRARREELLVGFWQNAVALAKKVRVGGGARL